MGSVGVLAVVAQVRNVLVATRRLVLKSEFLFVAVDDHARIGFTQMKPDERQDSATAFLRASIAYFAQLGVTVSRVLTDNGPAFRSKHFNASCRRLGLKHHFTRPYRPQTNGKAERFIQSALREWAYGIPYHRATERTAMLQRWTHHYNWHRPHQGIALVSRQPIQKQPVEPSQLVPSTAVEHGCVQLPGCGVESMGTRRARNGHSAK